MKSRLIPAVAKAVREKRVSLGLSQEELAHRSGLDRTYISGVERGVRNITLGSLEQILNALETELSTFFSVALNNSLKETTPGSADNANQCQQKNNQNHARG